jgi:hypothetical protein
MLKWSTKSELTDTTVATAAKGVITFDLKEAKYMLKLSATAWKKDIVHQDQLNSFQTGLHADID